MNFPLPYEHNYKLNFVHNLQHFLHNGNQPLTPVSWTAVVERMNVVIRTAVLGCSLIT